MGIYDRDYYRPEPQRGFLPRTYGAVATIIVLNVAAWLVQIVFAGGDRLHGGPITRALACPPEAIFSGVPQLWRLVTANFAHSWSTPWHIFMNMLFLYFFGRELEALYGRRNFWILYLLAGSLGVLAETVSLHMSGHDSVQVLGASAAVAAIVVVFTLHFPKRQILFFFFIPMPVWVLCGFFLLQDVLGVTYNTGSGVAHFAHLVGAGFGFLYKYLDLRWERVASRFTGLGPRRGRRGRFRVLLGGSQRSKQRTGVASAGPPNGEEPRDEVSERIDRILAKIHRDGMPSLTDEEREFLIENSRRYKGS